MRNERKDTITEGGREAINHYLHQVSIALSYGSSPETFWAFASVVN